MALPWIWNMAQALWARGYRMIAGFDVLWLKGMAASVRGWTMLDPA